MSRPWIFRNSLSLARRRCKSVRSFGLAHRSVAAFHSTRPAQLYSPFHANSHSCVRLSCQFWIPTGLQRDVHSTPETSGGSKDSACESDQMLLETDEREEVALRQILRERFQSTVPNWQEPLSVWRNEETGEIEWLEAQNISAETLEPIESNPWFVDEPEPEPVQTTNVSSSSPIPPPPLPPGLPDKLLPLYRYLIDSPFLDRDTISFIDAKAELYGHGDAAWTDWVIVVQLKEGREGGIRGATEAVREILSATKTAQVRVEGITGNPSSTWTMVDAGKAVVHILTKESRQIYKIEDIWTGQREPLAA